MGGGMSYTRRHGGRPSWWRGCWSPVDWHDRTLGVRRREVIAGARKARWMAPRDSQAVRARCPGRWSAVTDTVDPGVAWTRAALCSTRYRGRQHSLLATMDLCVKHSTPSSYWQCQISPPGRLYGEGRRAEDRRCAHPRRRIIYSRMWNVRLCNDNDDDDDDDDDVMTFPDFRLIYCTSNTAIRNILFRFHIYFYFASFFYGQRIAHSVLCYKKNSLLRILQLYSWFEKTHSPIFTPQTLS